jgi:hypothetical protein
MEDKKTRALILCAGDGERWGDYQGFPKHLIKIEGERLIDRTIRLIKKYSPKTEIVVVANDKRYSIEGTELYKPALNPNNLGSDNWLSSLPKWNKEARTYFVLGDVWFSENAIKRIFEEDPSNEWKFYGREGRSRFTGKTWEEWFCMSFMPKHHDFVEKTLRTLIDLVNTSQITRAGGWEFYREMKKSASGNHFVVIDDFTEDFDFPIDYDRWIEHREKYLIKQNKKELNIVIATPSVRAEVPMQFHQAVIAMLLKTREKYPNMKFATMTAGNTYVHMARQQMTDSFIDNTEGDYMLWIDDDNIPPEDGLIRLLEREKDVIGGLYFKRKAPYEPIIMMKRRQGIGSERRADLYRKGMGKPFKVHSTGFGFMLVKREVLEQMRAMRMSHFSMKVGLGEDIWFCIQAQGAGYDIWIDPLVEVGHLGDKQIITGKTYQDYYDTHLNDLVKKAENIDGYMSLAELEHLVNEAANVDFSIEVGSWKGRSSTVLSASGKLVCVDQFEGKLDGKGQQFDGQFMEFLKNMDKFDNVSYLKGDSVELAKNFPEECADLILIDGGHTYEQCKSDIENYWNKLKVGGKMLIHDYCETGEAYPGIKQAVQEFSEKMGSFIAHRQVPNTTFYELLKI